MIKYKFATKILDYTVCSIGTLMILYSLFKKGSLNILFSGFVQRQLKSPTYLL